MTRSARRRRRTSPLASTRRVLAIPRRSPRTASSMRCPSRRTTGLCTSTSSAGAPASSRRGQARSKTCIASSPTSTRRSPSRTATRRIRPFGWLSVRRRWRFRCRRGTTSVANRRCSTAATNSTSATSVVVSPPGNCMHWPLATGCRGAIHAQAQARRMMRSVFASSTSAWVPSAALPWARTAARTRSAASLSAMPASRRCTGMRRLR